mgnify:CR=1 FL=1|jgi:Signal transduction histidine kinase
MIRWWRRRSLRFRLAAWYGFGGIVLLTAFSVVIYGFVSQRMAQPLDRQLRADFASVREHLSLDSDGRLLWDARPIAPGDTWSWNDPWFEVWDEQGRLVLRLWPLDDARLGQIPFAPVPGWETLTVFNVTPDLRLRVLSAPWHPAGNDDAPSWMLRVMRVHKPAADALNALLLILAISLPVVVALLVLVGYLLTRHWLRPLHDMVAEAERIGAHDIDRRLPVKNPHDELGRLAAVFNGTLDRLAESFATLDRFSADASHELRTPLTTLRSVGEVALQRVRSADEYREVIGSMLEEVQRLQTLVDRLLQLARATGGMPDVHREPTRVDHVVSDCVGELEVLAEERGQHLSLDIDEYRIFTDPVLLRQVLQNLLDNAIKFGPPGSTIEISARATEAWCEISVADEGPGIPQEWRPRVTDRFFRADLARSEGGFGLGLAIAKAYLNVLDGRLEYEARQPHGSVFRILLPRR